MKVAFELVPIAGEGGSGSGAPASMEKFDALIALAPDLVFVADPPGLGNDAAVAALVKRVGTRLVPHLTTRNLRAEDAAERMGAWRGAGVAQVLALRGDRSTSCDLSRDQRLRSGRELVQLLVALDPALEVWCAGYPEVHPEAASAAADRRALLAKVEAGAAGIVCQFTFSAEPFLRYRDRLHEDGVDVPLYAGVMPLADAGWLLPFARDCGATLPAPLAAACERFADDASALEAFGIEHAAGLVRELAAAGVDGVEVFTRNAAARTRKVLEAAGLR